MFRRDKNKQREDPELDRLRQRVEDGDLGGELDGVLSDDERNRLEFYLWLIDHGHLPNEKDERSSSSSEEMKNWLDSL